MIAGTRIDCDVWEAAGPLSLLRIQDVEEDWVVIKSSGECNRDVTVPPGVAAVMQERLTAWLSGDLSDYNAFSMCDLLGGRCTPGFFWSEGFEPEVCPFAKVQDKSTGKFCCCHTVIAGGVTFDEILDIVCDFIENIGPSPRRSEKFREYVRAMLNFYRTQKQRKGE